MRWIGHRLHVDAELDVDSDIPLTAAHKIAQDAEHVLTHVVPKLSTALVHAYPAHTAEPAHTEHRHSEHTPRHEPHT